MDIWGYVHALHAARGEVYTQRSGPVGPAGAGVVACTARANDDDTTLCALAVALA